ncbi:hypothetical protein WJX73_005083, partial [Symbiochloris irregularis]
MVPMHTDGFFIGLRQEDMGGLQRASPTGATYMATAEAPVPQQVMQSLAFSQATKGADVTPWPLDHTPTSPSHTDIEMLQLLPWDDTELERTTARLAQLQSPLRDNDGPVPDGKRVLESPISRSGLSLSPAERNTSKRLASEQSGAVDAAGLARTQQ